MARHVVHLVYRFAAGGLENVIVQLVNGLPHDAFRHTIIALTVADPAFVSRIERKDVTIIELHKPPGQPFGLYREAFRLLRSLQPDVVHSCNLAALEFQPVAWAAGVARRVHAEHGWDVADPQGMNQRFRWLRRLYKHFVQRFIAVSPQLRDYLAGPIGVPSDRIALLPNGVDVERFRSKREGAGVPSDFPFLNSDELVIGYVGRFEPIKNPELLLEAFGLIASGPSAIANRVRLVMVGAGPLQSAIAERAAQLGLSARIWLPGARSDVADVLRALHCFVLPSLSEGTSCTLLEAMASEIPVVATDVGGNRDVLDDGRLGQLVPSQDHVALAAAIVSTLTSAPDTQPARTKVVSEYSLPAMLGHYVNVFS